MEDLGCGGHNARRNLLHLAEMLSTLGYLIFFFFFFFYTNVTLTTGSLPVSVPYASLIQYVG